MSLIDMIELTDLKHFVHVARERSFTAGARRSHVTPPAVSKAVQKLEAELGAQLLTRTTAEGRVDRGGTRAAHALRGDL